MGRLSCRVYHHLRDAPGPARLERWWKLLSVQDFFELYLDLHTLWEISHNVPETPIAERLDEDLNIATNMDARLASKLIEILDSERFDRFEEYEWFADLYEGLRTLLTAASQRECEIAERLLDTGCLGVGSYMEQLKLRLFGAWGKAFFEIYVPNDVACLTEEDVREFKRIKETLLAGRVDRAIDLVRDANTARTQYTLFEKSFSLKAGQGDLVKIGNRMNQFRFLKLLMERPNEYVPVLDILDELGKRDDSNVAPATKLRLVKFLYESGFDDLASSIKSNEGHYGLFFPEENLKIE